MEEALRLNELQFNAVYSGWEAPQRADFGAGSFPVFAYVYGVVIGVPASALHALHDAYNVRGENVSRMDGGPVPWGLRLTLEQAEPLASALVAAGRGERAGPARRGPACPRGAPRRARVRAGRAPAAPGPQF